MARCEGLDGCRAILRETNKTGICGACQDKIDKAWVHREEKIAVRSERKGEKYLLEQKMASPLTVGRVIRAADFFCGVREQAVTDGRIPFAKEVAIFLLKTDFHMRLEFIGERLKLDYKRVQLAFEKIRTLAESSPEFQQNLEQIRTQYNHEGPA